MTNKLKNNCILITNVATDIAVTNRPQGPTLSTSNFLSHIVWHGLLAPSHFLLRSSFTRSCRLLTFPSAFLRYENELQDLGLLTYIIDP